MKKVIGAIAVGIFLSTFAYAQQGPGPERGTRNMPPEERVAKMVAHMSEKLSLTDEQKDKFTAIHLAHFEESRKLLAAAENREEGREIRTEQELALESELAAVLDDTQMVQYREMKEKRQEHRSRRHGHRKGHGSRS